MNRPHRLYAFAFALGAQISDTLADDRATCPLFAVPPVANVSANQAPSAPANALVPISMRIREQLNARIHAVAAKIPSPPPGVPIQPNNPIMLEPYAVDTKRLPIVVPPPQNRFLEAVKSGNLWRLSDRLDVVSRGETGAGDYGRITFGFRFW